MRRYLSGYFGQGAAGLDTHFRFLIIAISYFIVCNGKLEFELFV